MSRQNHQFTTIRTEGALLPPDILRRIASQKVEGIRPGDYHLPEGFKVNEAITQSWDMLKKHWKSFLEAKEQLGEEDTGTSLTNERWLLPLFKELDYGRLQTGEPPVIEEKTYPIRRFYNHTPIHLIGWNLPLDKRTKGAAGAATASPHSMVQEFLNRSDEHLWAILSNGRQLRLLRDNIALSRQAYVEFDLEAMMEGEVYSDFALLWVLCHQSRLEDDKQEECWLEKWSKLAREEGTRVLNNLRKGVANAIEALGEGFLAHPQNDDLRSKLQESGSLSKDDFYRQLLRIVYRMLFLFVAEDRELLHPSDTEEETKDLYRKYYSTSRLREMSRKLRGSKHGDLWHSFSLVSSALGKNEGCSQLGLIGLGSFLWKPESVSALVGPHEASGDEIPVQIANDDLLAAIRELAYVEQDRILRTVDYRNLGSEELGSVYESLLELHPDIHIEARHFELRSAAGNERKTSGSYYTPDSLVQCLLDSALDPVVVDRLKGKKGQEAQDAILSMKVCDPACGSGHFLIAAAHRMARHLARLRTGETEPSPEDHQHALRDVIGRCIYGVDINPMAVELCKVSLWIEAIEPGKPLSFLDSHIQCGNSLLGTTPKLLADGIPDDAFKPIEGDDKKVAAALKKQNKAERKDRLQGQKSLFSTQDGGASLGSKFSELSELDDSTVDAVAEKEQMHAGLMASSEYQDSLLIADTWCSTFVWKKDESEEGKLCPTDQDFAELKQTPAGASEDLKLGVQRLSRQYQFFHWYLAFPDVFELPDEAEEAENEQTSWGGGFDVVLGNPPWESIQNRNVDSNAREKEDRIVAAQQQFLATSRLFPHSGKGRKNLYALFVELSVKVKSTQARAGLVVPTGLVQDKPAEALLGHLLAKSLLHSVFDFENRGVWFPDVHRQYRFCLAVFATACEQISFVFDCDTLAEIREPGRRVLMSKTDIEQLCHENIKVPMFRSAHEELLAQTCYHNSRMLGQLEAEDVVVSGLMFNFGPAEKKLKIELPLNEQIPDGYTRIFEGELMNQFTHRFASYRDGIRQRLEQKDLEDPSLVVSTPDLLPVDFVESRIRQMADSLPNGLPTLRRHARSGDSFVAISSIIPLAASEASLSVFFPKRETPQSSLALCGNLNSFLFNYLLGLRLSGPSPNKGTYGQVPVVTYDVTTALSNFDHVVFGARVLELTYTAWDLEAFASDCGYAGPPFRWDEERRFLLRCELDAAYFHLYLGPPAEWGTDSPQLREMFPTPRDAVDYIMETFPIVKRKDIARTEIKNDKGEVTAEGTFITKDTILAIYDEMQTAIDTGQPFQTRLDPPAGPPTDADGNFIPMAQWDEANWPSHIHPPREQSGIESGAKS